MPISTNTGTAEIIAFPVRFRTPGARYETLGPKAEAVSPRIYDAAFSSSWYHEAAVQEAERGPKS
jgi:hypothetical protein